MKGREGGEGERGGGATNRRIKFCTVLSISEKQEEKVTRQTMPSLVSEPGYKSSLISSLSPKYCGHISLHFWLQIASDISTKDLNSSESQSYPMDILGPVGLDV